jgi:hypothetical protein
MTIRVSFPNDHPWTAPYQLPEQAKPRSHPSDVGGAIFVGVEGTGRARAAEAMVLGARR